jgi:Flp pilus assembly protein TadG
MQGMSEREKLARKRSGRRRGSAIVEFSLLCPWLIFLFLGAVDAGFMLYALTSVENAARAAAVYAAQADLSTPVAITTATNKICSAYVVPSLVFLANLPNGLTTACGSTPTPNPVSVVVTSISAGTSPDASGAAVTVTVYYLTPRLFPIFSGVGTAQFPGQIVIARAVTARHS